jgi:hypothetical protein
MKTIFGYEDKAVIKNRENNNEKDNHTISITVHSLKIIPTSDNS